MVKICGHKSKSSARKESTATRIFYSREDYNLFRIVRQEGVSDEDTSKAVKKLFDDERAEISRGEKPRIHNEARYRALYIAVARARFETFEYILGDMGVKIPDTLKTLLMPPASHSNTTQHPLINDPPANDDDTRVREAIKHLLSGVPAPVTEDDIYFPDRDGQCLMHYIAKDGFTDIFKYLVEEKDYNPLCRDRLGRTAWDLAYAKVKRAEEAILTGEPAQDQRSPRISPDLIRNYVLKASVNLKRSPDKSEEIICINQLQKKTEPTDSRRFSPKGFLEILGSANPFQLAAGDSTVPGNAEREAGGWPPGLVWIQLDENNDALFTAIIHKVCELKDFKIEEIAQIFKFHGDTFLQQDQGEPHFKFRQPSYQTFHLRKDIEIVSIVMPFFDSGDPKDGERGSHLDENNLQRTSRMNVHVQRTLDETYYLGLDKKKLERRNYNEILNDDKFSPKSKNILLVSQLWLWKIDNVVITAFPREMEYKSSNLFDHTLSLLRDIGLKARMGLTSDQFVAWIVSECIHRLDYPCMADLEEPITYFLGKVVAVTLEEIEDYVDKKNGGLLKNDIEKEKLFIGQISAVRSKINMIKNIVLRQEEVWKTLNKHLTVRLWKKPSNKDTLAKVKDLTLRPKDDFQKLKHQIQKIERDSERAEAVILVQLDLKGKHASLREAHNSLLLSMAVIGFTVITIIFAPLSFLTSLFALPIDQLQNQHDHTQKFTVDYITRWLGLAELATWALTGVCVFCALLLIQWMEKMPSQFLRPAAIKIWRTILSPFRRKGTDGTGDGEDRGAKLHGQGIELRDINSQAAIPTPDSPEIPTPRHRWFSHKSKINHEDE